MSSSDVKMLPSFGVWLKIYLPTQFRVKVSPVKNTCTWHEELWSSSYKTYANNFYPVLGTRWGLDLALWGTMCTLFESRFSAIDKHLSIFKEPQGNIICYCDYEQYSTELLFLCWVIRVIPFLVGTWIVYHGTETEWDDFKPRKTLDCSIKLQGIRDH